LHTVDLINSFKNKFPEITFEDAFKKVFKKLQEGLNNWVHTLKSYTIFHVALQDQDTSMKTAKELKALELSHYNKKLSKNELKQCIIIAEKNHVELSQLYSVYIKNLSLFITDYKLIDKLEEIQIRMIRSKGMDDVLGIYEIAKEMLQNISGNFYRRDEFCMKYRIYKNMLRLLYIDLIRLYRICYYCVIALSSKLKDMEFDQAKVFLQIYNSFEIVTEETKGYLMAIRDSDPLPATLNYFKVPTYSNT